MEDHKIINLLSLRIKNFRSFGEEQEITFSSDGLSTRRVTAIVGLNATGKSNIFKAMELFKTMVKNSANAGYRLPYVPFLYNSYYAGRPTEIELSFRYSDSTYSYRVAFNETTICHEVLKEKPSNSIRAKTIFERFNNKINPGAINHGFNQGLINRTRQDTLLITKAIENNNKYANIVLKAVNSFCILSCTNNQLEGMAITLLRKKPELIEKTISALKKADLSIHDIRIDNVAIPDEVLSKIPLPDDVKQSMRLNPGVMINLGHVLKNGYGKPVMKNGKITYFSAGIENESIGTRAFLGVIVPIIDSILQNKILFIDEFGAYLHYGLIQRIIKTYLSQEKAPGLIVNTHAGMVLDCIERDSTFVLTKNPVDEITHIHKMIEAGARKNDHLSRNYYTNSRYDFLSFRSDDLF